MPQRGPGAEQAAGHTGTARGTAPEGPRAPGWFSPCICVCDQQGQPNVGPRSQGGGLSGFDLRWYFFEIYEMTFYFELACRLKAKVPEPHGRVSNPSSPRISHVTTHKSLDSVPQFPCLQNGDINSIRLLELFEDEEVDKDVGSVGKRAGIVSWL